MINPWAIVAALLLLASSSAGAFFYGKQVGRDGLLAEQSTAKDAAAARDAERAQTVEAIATAAGAAVATAMNQNTGVTHASVERIRTVVVPGECRAADPVLVSELRAGERGINDALRSGLRRIAAAAGAPDPGHTP